MTHPSCTTRRNALLDSLRALAIIMVLGYHLAPEYVPFGYLGVDVFFVLSGVFIAWQIGVPGASPLPYLLRRVLRLWPATVVTCLGVIALGWAFLLPKDFAEMGTSILTAVSFTTNLLPPSNTGYFDAGTDSMPLLHIWSLGLEAQVYLAAALLLPFGRRLLPLPVILLLILASSFSYSGWHTFTTGEDIFYDPAARAWQFALGGLMGYAALPGREVSWGLVAGLLAALAVIPANAITGAQATLLASGLAALAIGLSLHDETTLPRAILAPLSSLGRISFGIYLWHWPIIVIWDIATLSERTVMESLGLAAISILLGLTSFLAVERPVQNAGRRAPLVTLSLCGATALFTALLGISLVVSAGAPQRLPDRVHDILSETRRAHDQIETCHLFPDYPDRGFPVEKSCRHNAENGPVRTAALGDSHAMTLAGGLARTGLPFVEYSYSGCAPITTLYPATHGPACPERVTAALEAILEDPEIRTVIVAARWGFYTAPRFDNGRGGRDRHPDVIMHRVDTGLVASDLRVRQAAIHTIDTLLAGGKQVIAIGPTPVFGWHVEHTAARAAWYGTDVDLSVSAAQMDARQGGMRDKLSGLTAPGYHFIDPAPLFCNEEICSPQSADGTLLFRDQDHLSVQGTNLVAQHINAVLSGSNKRDD